MKSCFALEVESIQDLQRIRYRLQLDTPNTIGLASRTDDHTGNDPRVEKMKLIRQVYIPCLRLRLIERSKEDHIPSHCFERNWLPVIEDLMQLR